MVLPAPFGPEQREHLAPAYRRGRRPSTATCRRTPCAVPVPRSPSWRPLRSCRRRWLCAGRSLCRVAAPVSLPGQLLNGNLNSGHGQPRLPERDRPWVMRTYAGHSSAAASNALFRRNLAKGQTGLSVAFDLPTQTGYDPDARAGRRRGRPGRRAGRAPRRHAGALRRHRPRPRANTSMTINATAMWLLALYVTVGRRSRAPPLRGAGRHDAERHRQGVPVPRHLHLPAGAVAAADHRHDRLDGAPTAPTVEPGQRLLVPPAGGRRDAGAGGRVRAGHRGRRARRGARLGPGAGRARSATSSQRISFFVNAGVRFVEEMAKMRAFAALWDELTARAVRRHRRRGSGGSATACRSTRSGLTEAQPENNVQRIVLEMLGVTLSRDARARAVQLPAWNEALGPAPPVGPAVVAADAAGAGVRVGPARVPRPVRRLARGGRRWSTSIVDGARRRARQDPGAGRRGRRRRVGLPQERAGRLAGRAPPAASSPATTWWSASTGSPRPSRRR